MKILVISNLYPPAVLGGYEIKCALQVQELKKRGYQVDVLTSQWNAGGAPYQPNVHRWLHLDPLSPIGALHGLNDWGALGLRKRKAQLAWGDLNRRNYLLTRRLIKDTHPDLVYLWNCGGLSFQPQRASQDAGLPLVFRISDYGLAELYADLYSQPNPLKRFYRQWIEGMLGYRGLKFHTGVFISDWVKNYYQQAGFQFEQTCTILDGLPDEWMLTQAECSPPPSPGSPFRLLHAGRLDPSKGTHLAISAVAWLAQQTPERSFRLDIYGRGSPEYTEQLHDLIQANSLGEKVRLCGYAEHRDILALHPNYHAILLPAEWEEPLSGTIAEAMSRGLPVIASTRGGTPELIQDGVNGLLVKSGDAVSLGQAILHLAQDTALWRRIQAAALETAHNQCSLQSLVTKVEIILKNAQSTRTTRSDVRTPIPVQPL